MKNEKEILNLLTEGKSYSFIQAQLGVYPSQVATVVSKYFKPSATREKRTSRHELSEQHKQLTKLQESYQVQSERANILEEINQNISAELRLQSEDLNSNKKDLEALRTNHNKALLTIQQWSSAYENLKIRLEVSEKERTALQEKVKLIEQQQEIAQIKYDEIIKSIQAGEMKHFFFVPDWAWTQIKEMSPVNLQATAAKLH